MKYPAILALTGLAVCGSASAIASSRVETPGVSDTSVLLGQSCALKGPAAGLGKGMQSGLETYFDSINAAGGVDGRQIKLKSLNDGYEPEKAELATRTLIEKMKVFLMIGEVGTPTSKVAVPVCEEANVPFVAPFTGAEFLRSPFKRHVVNFRGSYYQEMERLAQHLVDNQGLTRIACFYQDDSYGRAGLSGIQLALGRREMSLVSEGTYQRNTIAVASGLAQIAEGNPEAVIMVGAYKPCSTFIKAAKKNPGTQNATFCNISFVGTMNLLEELGPDSEGCIVSQVVPFPWDRSVPVVDEYHKAMKQAGKSKEIGFITLEGYLAGKLFCQILNNVDGAPTRDSFLDTVQKVGEFDLGGVVLEFGEEDHQGMSSVFLTAFENGKVVPVE